MLKWLVRFVMAIVLFVVLVVVSLQFSAVQTLLARQVVNVISGRTGTDVQIEHVGIRLPKAIDIRGIFLEDEIGDTLLYAGRLTLDVYLPGLLRNKITVNHLLVSDVHANITRIKPDSLFNYDFLLKAITGNDDNAHRVTGVDNGLHKPDTLENIASPWEYELKRIMLDNIRLRFADHHSGIDVHFQLGAFDTGFNALDPTALLFHLGDVMISDAGLLLHVQEGSVPPDPNREASAASPDIALQKLLLENISFTFIDDQGFEFSTTLNALEVNPHMLDLQQMDFHLGSFSLDGFMADVLLPGLTADALSETHKAGLLNETINSDTLPKDNSDDFAFYWNEIMPVRLLADHINITDAAFVMRERVLKASGDWDDQLQMKYTELNIQMESVNITPDTVALNLQHLGFHIDDGPSLKGMSGSFNLGKGARIGQLMIETGESLLEAELATSIPVLQFSMPVDNRHKLDKLELRATIGNDLLAIMPAIEGLFPHGLGPDIELSLKADGTMQQVSIKEMVVNVDNVLHAVFEETAIRNFLWTDSLFVNIPSFALTARPVLLFDKISDELKPPDIAFPDSLWLAGRFSGYPADFDLAIDIHTEFASLSASAAMNQTAEKETAWTIAASLQGEKPFAFIGQDELMNDLFARLEAAGTGFDIESMLANISLQLDSVCFGAYVYRGLNVSAKLDAGLIDSRAEYHDEHLSFEFINNIDLRQTHPKVLADWRVKHVNAYELGFTEELIALQTRIAADLELTSPAFFDGSIRLDDTHVLSGREVFTLDSLVIKTASRQGQFLADIRSPILHADYHGNISPADIPAALAVHINSYLEKDIFDAEIIAEPYFFNLSLNVFPSPYLTEIILPSVTSYETINASAGFDSRTRIISLDVDIPGLDILGWQIRDLSLAADSDPEFIDFKLRASELMHQQINLTNIYATGSLQEQKLVFDLSFDDMHQEAWLGISGELLQNDDFMTISLDTDMMVNRFYWQVREGNQLILSDSYLLAHDMVIGAADKEISLLSTDPGNVHSPLELHLKNINLGDFDLLGDTPIIEGLFNGKVVLNDIFGKMSFTADLLVDGIGYQGSKIGDVSLFVDNPSPDHFLVEASVSGFGNVVGLSGFYNQEDIPHMDFNLRLDQLDLSTLEALTFDQLDDMEGIISGDLRVFGELSEPDFSGTLNFDSLGFHVAFLNSRYHIPAASIGFEDQRIIFDNFDLFDQGGRQASLSGQVFVGLPDDIHFDLNLSSTNFMAMNIPKGANELFHGRMLIDTDLTLAGALSDPVLEGRLKLNQGSSFTFIVPQFMPEAIGDEGVVEFVRIHEDLFADLVLHAPEPDPIMSSFENLDMSLNIEIDPQTHVTIVIDEMAGDELSIRGGGVLSFGIDPGGRISLAGRYEINDGSYQMTFFDVRRRNFAIERGSTILWTGDPLDASLDITARYSVRTSPRELMASHSAVGGQQEPAFRRQYPFDVFLNMKGDLMSPDISFRIDLPQEHRSAMDGRLQARLNEVNENESDLNKQVFALLILGSFIQDDPLAAMTAGPGISATARSSASRLLSQQLNRLSDRYIRGVELSFDIESYEDYADGQMVGRTELQMEISRDFLDDRLRITAGGNLELEDETRRQLNPADIAGDFSVEYLVTPDGRLVIKVYRERKFQDVFDGEVVENGLAVIFRQTYNRFRELFRRKQFRNDMF